MSRPVRKLTSYQIRALDRRVVRLIQASVADSWKGAGSIDDGEYDATELEFEEAQKAYVKYLDRLLEGPPTKKKKDKK